MKTVLLPGTLSGVLLIAGALAGSPEKPGGSIPLSAPAVQDTLIGTVRSVDPRSGTIEMITGVGLVLRTYRVQVDETVPVWIAGGTATLTALAPGRVVRIVYQTTTAGRVAAYVEVVTWSDS